MGGTGCVRCMNQVALMETLREEISKNSGKRHILVGERLFIDVLNHGGFNPANFKLNEWDTEYDKYWHTLTLLEGEVTCATHDELFDSEEYMEDSLGVRKREVRENVVFEERIQGKRLVELCEEDFMELLNLGMGRIIKRNYMVKKEGFKSKLEYEGKQYYTFTSKPLKDFV